VQRQLEQPLILHPRQRARTDRVPPC
jgi:hypothetical protein